MKAKAEHDAAMIARYAGLSKLENDFTAVANGTPMVPHELGTLVDRAEDLGVIGRDSVAGNDFLKGGRSVAALCQMTRLALARVQQDPAVRDFLNAQP